MKLQSYVATILSKVIQLCVEDDFVSDGFGLQELQDKFFERYEISSNNTARFSVKVTFLKIEDFTETCRS